MISFPTPIPAHSKAGTDHYLLLGMKPDGDFLAIDQEGDIRLIFFAEVQTEWVFFSDLEVWFNRQRMLEDLEEEDEDSVERNVEDLGGDSGGAVVFPDSGDGDSPGSVPVGTDHL